MSEVTSNPPLAWGQRVSQQFRDSVYWIADELTKLQGAPFDPNWLMACMAFESGETFSPSIKNAAGSGAVGLIQFMPGTAVALANYRKVNLTTKDLAAMTPVQQLTWVHWYFVMTIKVRGPIKNLEDCYMAILWPSAIGSPVESVLWDAGKWPTTYRQNAGLDVNKDKKITKAEAASMVRAKLEKGLRLAA